MVRRTLPPRSAAAFLARVKAFFSPTAVYLPSPLGMQYLTRSGLLTTSILSLCAVGLRHPKVIVSTRPHRAMFLCKRMTPFPFPIYEMPIVYAHQCRRGVIRVSWRSWLAAPAETRIEY